jgi:hypothetical protein
MEYALQQIPEGVQNDVLAGDLQAVPRGLKDSTPGLLHLETWWLVSLSLIASKK